MRGLSVFLLAAAVACQDNKLGDDIGRPRLSRPDRPTLAGVMISEVFAWPTSFVEVQAGAEGAALDGLSVCNDFACVPLSGTLGAGAYGSVDATLLSLNPSAGEVAVVGPAPLGSGTLDNAVHAYLAWGADPAVFNTDFAALALWGGAWDGAYVPLPFPMTDGVAIAPIAGVWGCAVPSQDGVATNPAACPEGPPVLAITEILAVTNGDSWVEILNTSGDPQFLYGARLCQMPHCVTFDRNLTLAPSDRLLVHLGAEFPACSGGDQAACEAVFGCTWNDPTCDPASGHVYFPDAEPVRASGELALLAPGPSALDQGADALAAFQSFVRYGAATGRLSDAAVAASKWSQSLDSAVTPRIAEESLSVDTSCNAGGSAWNPTYATPLAPEEDICALQGSDCVCGATTWTSCSFPAPARRAPASVLLIRKLAYGTPSTLEIFNSTGAPLDLTGYELALGPDPTYPLSGTLDGGATLIVELDPTPPASCAASECWENVDLGPDGEASLLENGVVRQHVQWGVPPGVRGPDAEIAGVWPHLSPPTSTNECSLAFCPSPCTSGQTLSCASWAFELTAGDGQSPIDYELTCACTCQ